MAATKKKPVLGPDGVPIMQSDLPQQNPVGGYSPGAPFPIDTKMQVDVPGMIHGALTSLANAYAASRLTSHASPPLVNPSNDRPENGTYYNERAPMAVDAPTVAPQATPKLTQGPAPAAPANDYQGYQGSPRLSTDAAAGPITRYDTGAGRFVPYQPPPEERWSVLPSSVTQGYTPDPTTVGPPAPMTVDTPRTDSNTLPAIPFNDRLAHQRARADYQRALHTDIAGPLGSPESEARIAMIRQAEDVRNAYAMRDRPLQTIQTPGQIANAHSELGRQGAEYAKNEVLDAQAKMAALTDQIKAGNAPPDFADKMAFQQARLERGQAIMDKFTRDPYWQQMTNDQAVGHQAGQQAIRDRQMADRQQGSAAVAAYQARDAYGRNTQDQLAQAEFQRQKAALGADTARSQSIIDNKGLTPADRVAGAQADVEVAKANAIIRVLGSPDAAAKFEQNFKRSEGLTSASPDQIQLAGNMLDTTLQKMGDLAGETWFTNNGQIDYTNRENMNAALDIADSAVKKLESAYGDYPEDVAARASMLLASMPPWMSQGGAFPRWIEPWNKDNRETANRLNAIGTRLKALAGIGSSQSQGQ